MTPGIIASFGVQDQALLDIISGAKSPSGLLPLQMPADMRTVEEQKEDVPRDMKCHVDTEGTEKLPEMVCPTSFLLPRQPCQKPPRFSP